MQQFWDEISLLHKIDNVRKNHQNGSTRGRLRSKYFANIHCMAKKKQPTHGVEFFCY